MMGILRMTLVKKIVVAVLFCVLCVSNNFLPAFADTPVNGYTRRDGTYVQPHMRSDRDSSFSNNWSTKGNINPYTNERDYKQEPTYNNNAYRLKGY